MTKTSGNWTIEAAQKLLEARRHEAGIVYCPPTAEPQTAAPPLPTPNRQLEYGQWLLEARRHEAGIDYRPPAAEPAPFAPLIAPALLPPARPSQTAALVGDVVRVYPDIHTAAHAAGQDAAARLYLVCRHIDPDGRGWVETAELRAQLEGRGLLTWKRIRQIIAGGQGVFWERVSGRAGDVLRYKQPAHILRALGAGRPTFHPVNIPARSLYGSIADYRAAAVYAAVLAGRRRPNMPISQAAIKDATGGMSARAQRRYRRSAAVRAVRTYRLEAIPTDCQGKFYALAQGNRGRMAYLHRDHRGLVGAPFVSYMAIAQPNTYTSATAQRGRRGRLSKIRRDLPSLNILERGKRCERTYFENGGAAWRSWARRPRPVVWPISVKRPARPVYWAAVPGGE